MQNEAVPTSERMPDRHHLTTREERKLSGKGVSKENFLCIVSVSGQRTRNNWTSEEERQLRALIRVGLSMGQLAKVLNRSMDDIAKELQCLGRE